MKNQKIKLIVLLSSVLLLFFLTFSFCTTNVKIRTTVEQSIANQSLETAKSIAANFDTDTYEKFLRNPVKNEYYWELNDDLNDIREELGALYVYTLEIDNPKVSKTMIMGLPKEEQDFFIIGTYCTVPEEQVNIAYYEGKPYTTKIIKDTGNDTYLSVGAPILDKTNNVIGYIGIDIDTKRIDEIKESVIKNNILFFVFNSIFLLIVILSFYFIQRWYQKEAIKEVENTEDTYLTEIKSLISSVSSLKHDFSNHMQVIHGLLAIGESTKAQQYVESLSKEVQLIESINLKIEHPVLGILLQTKKLAAQNHQIDMDITVTQHSFNQIKSTDLIKLLSNLIDNAVDATMELPEEKRKISIHCSSTDCYYLFKVINTGPKISSEDIFKQGYSTKKVEQGKTRGQGLFIVKEVVNKYNGEITIYSTNGFETIASIEIPIK